MSNAPCLVDYQNPPRVSLRGTDEDPLKTGLAQVCDPAQKLLKALVNGTDDQELAGRYQQRKGLLRTWRKAIMDDIRRQRVLGSAKQRSVIAENLQVVAGTIWKTPMDQQLELVRCSKGGTRSD